ncbi:MAG: hypothetical protein A4E20_12080 [Nitrospira sp. SG-bin2]|uniref:hypothetical protein n=1 Tax=Nitrospira cf. moscoviensis SBR1015 TaxID=96242 RepID=UPI000A0C905D|nr:hypothetical protein [Nitrospira cf. moscoviensis SBR1015]OQW33960.1 MAG: hypothetical protein A4E20_12080 [Nitrospira sp. SG-bin2]
MAAAKPIKLPKTMGACADLLYETREKRLAAQKIVDELAKQEAAVREHIINNLPKSDTGASGKRARVSVVTKQVPQVKDWDKFYAHVKKTGQFELMQRRLADTAIRERWDNGKQVPGVEAFGVVSVSLNKI